MLILILMVLTLPLYAAELSFDRRSLLGTKQGLLRADLAVIQAQLDECSEEYIKKREDERQKAAEVMLNELANSEESALIYEDIEFCFQYRPNVDISKRNPPPLISASESNITMVRELIKAGADVNQAIHTLQLGEHTTALMAAVNGKFSNTNVVILLEAGATIPYGLNLAAGKIGLRMWQNPAIIGHWQTMIDTINETRIFPTQLSPKIVNYAFGELPKINPVTKAGYYSDDKKEEEKE